MQTAFASQAYTDLDPTRVSADQNRLSCISELSRPADDAVEGLAPIVFVVDCDRRLSESLAPWSQSLGWQVCTFPSTNGFLDSPAILRPSCLVLNATVPDLDVLELQEFISAERPGMPIVLVGEMSNGPATLQARSTSSVRFFFQHPDAQALAVAISKALDRCQPAFNRWASVSQLRERFAKLTRREREVMSLVVLGRLNKQVGGDLGITEITVKAHRGNIMRKMRATSLPSLVTMAAQLGLSGPDLGMGEP